MRDTIDMAREAGLHIPYWGEEEDPKKDPPRWTMASPLPPLLKAFEALVRADEREACAKVCDEQVERSKEALAKAKRVTDQAVYRSGAQTAAWNAAAIRARGNT